ncbi:MAG: amidohydrolase family protein [Acidobacteria bacterium]|nr:amidohydrolase family protein [Acidobacteriota bacterium]
MRALAALVPVDTHTHVAKGDAAFYAMLARLHMHILNILLVDDHDPYRKNLNSQRADAERVIQESHGYASLCTSFDPFQFNNAGFAASAIRGLNQDFMNGAIAVKIWKNIGMELKDKSGRYVVADDPRFEPVYLDIQNHNRTLIAHQAEPDEAWEAANPNGLDYPYYKEHPIWYMYDKPGVPAKKQILDARDHLLAQNPKLRVAGAHLGSMEDDLNGLAQRFDRYPNFAVDTAARVVHMVVMPSDTVRAFILKYQDRIVYGTDLGYAQDEALEEVVKEWQDQYARDWRYFSTRDTFEYDRHKTEGLGLPPAVLRKLYHANAVRWFPGILASRP